MSFASRLAAWLTTREIRNQVAEWLERSLGRPLKRKEKAMLATGLTSWKTSLIGLVVAAVQLHQGGMTWGNALLAAAMALLGIAAKDSNVSGGTVKQ